MDTQFWGPPGHKLLHSIAYCYSFGDNSEAQDTLNRNIVKAFFSSIKHVLPCIYCRRSYAKYIKELPLKDFLSGESDKNLFKWVYLVHNKINGKLRKQGYLSEKNPSYSSVLKKYKKFIKSIDGIVGWDFLYSIVFNYPDYDFELSDARYNGYITFFTNIQFLLPCEKIRKIYASYINKYPIEKYMKTRKELKRWLYRLEKKINKKCCGYNERCKKIEKYRVDKCINKSCRKS